MEDIYAKLQDDTRSLWQSPRESVKRLKQVPSASTFFKDYVATSTPVIIAGGASGWKAASCWDLDTLSRVNQDLDVTVDWTPSGRGDCIVGGNEPDVPGVFVKPEARRMSFQRFVDALLAQGAQKSGRNDRRNYDEGDSGDGVLYLSHQVFPVFLAFIFSIPLSFPSRT